MNNVLIGKVLTGLKLADDKEALLFVTDQGSYKARCDADCCSYTWVEHITMPYKGLPALVLNVEDLDMPDLGDIKGCDYVQYYGLKIETDKGDIIIDYRNDSNGYYGGNLSWPDDSYFYGGVYGQNVSKEDWKDIIEDI
ncbi:MAG: hypothetical protein JKY52_09620 [Flavobacteriales bacterium]|nr:hypothetical protein [Flavobacteriales bacterium]